MGDVEWLDSGEGLPDADNPKAWVTVSEAALIVERDRKTVEDAIRKHAMPVRPGRNIKNQPTKFLHRPTLEDTFGISKGDMVGQSGHLEVVKGEREGEEGEKGNMAVGRFDVGDARDVTRYADVAQQLDHIREVLGVMPALELAVTALNERLEAIGEQTPQIAELARQLAAERERAVTAEQRAQAAAAEAAALRERAVRAEAAARQEPPRRGWLPQWPWSRG